MPSASVIRAYPSVWPLCRDDCGSKAVAGTSAAMVGLPPCPTLRTRRKRSPRSVTRTTSSMMSECDVADEPRMSRRPGSPPVSVQIARSLGPIKVTSLIRPDAKTNSRIISRCMGLQLSTPRAARLLRSAIVWPICRSAAATAQPVVNDASSSPCDLSHVLNNNTGTPIATMPAKTAVTIFRPERFCVGNGKSLRMAGHHADPP